MQGELREKVMGHTTAERELETRLSAVTTKHDRLVVRLNDALLYIAKLEQERDTYKTRAEAAERDLLVEREAWSARMEAVARRASNSESELSSAEIRGGMARRAYEEEKERAETAEKECERLRQSPCAFCETRLVESDAHDSALARAEAAEKRVRELEHELHLTLQSDLRDDEGRKEE